MKIYTHDEAMLIVEMFEDVLSKYDIHVPSPEDEERDEDDYAGLYGSTYSDLLDKVEGHLIELLANSGVNKDKIVVGEFSGMI